MADQSIRERTPEELAEIANYVKKLGQHDWWYSMSDDHSVYCRGRDERNQLVALRKKLDPDLAIWNTHTPKEFRK